MYRMQTTNWDGPTPQPPLKPTVIPSLKYRSVISVVLGDYHYGALAGAGKLLAWGQFAKGALGLGDPVDIEPGQLGGSSTREQRAEAGGAGRVGVHALHTPGRARADGGAVRP